MKLQTLTEEQISMTFVALALLLLFSYVFGTLLEKIKGPRVVGEILGGMLIGGSGMFLLMPEVMKKIFFAYPQQGQVLNIFYQLGLILLMFMSGYNTDIKVDRKNIGTISLVFFGATVIPMLLAIPFIGIFRKSFIGTIESELSFSLVFCIGVAITSIPVISKIFFNMGIMNTKFSNTILTVATLQDLCLWILLNIATRVAATGSIDLPQMLIIVGSTLGLFVLLTVISKRAKRINRECGDKLFFAICFILMLTVCGVLSRFGINNMYSAFIAGYIVKVFFGGQKSTEENIRSLEKPVFSFFSFGTLLLRRRCRLFKVSTYAHGVHRVYVFQYSF